MGLVSIYNLLDYKKLLAGDVPNVPDYILPDFAGGKVMEIEYYALKITGRFRQPFQRLAPSTYTLKTGLFLASDSSQLAYQTDVGFTNDAALSRKLGTLNLNTPAIDAIWAGAGSPTSADVVFVIDIETANGPLEVYRAAGRLIKPLITPAASVAPPGEIVATQSWVKGLFQALNSPAGSRRIERDDNGKPYEVYIGVDGQEQINPLDPVNTPPAVP
jgi:hypothetical protein